MKGKTVPNFENLHKNKKLAFLDGFLSGIVFAFIAKGFYNDYVEMKRLDALREEHARTHHS